MSIDEIQEENVLCFELSLKISVVKFSEWPGNEFKNRGNLYEIGLNVLFDSRDQILKKKVMKNLDNYPESQVKQILIKALPKFITYASGSMFYCVVQEK